MARVLVADDDESLCTSLGGACRSRGHDAELATDASAAVTKGLRQQPEVLITDWMLGGRTDGVLLSQALRAALPELRSVLITAFPSRDVHEEALRARFASVQEKPVDLERLHAAVEEAAAAEPPDVLGPRFGLLELGEDGRVLRTNATAADLLGLTENDRPAASGGAASLDTLFTPGSVAAVERAEGEWVPLAPRDEDRVTSQGWMLRGAPGATRVLLLLDARDEEATRSPVARVLTGTVEPPPGPPSPVPGRYLVVDSDPLQRRLAATQLRRAGSLHHLAESTERAVRTLEADPEIRVVLLDYATAGDALEETVRRLLEVRSGIVLVGTSAAYHREEFQEAGVERFLLKPVLATSLAEVLAE